MADCLKRKGLSSINVASYEHAVKLTRLACGDDLTHSSGTNDATTPVSGDVTVCLRCGHLMAYADDLTLRPLTDAEMHAIAGNPVVLDIQRMRAAYHQRGRRQ